MEERIKSAKKYEIDTTFLLNLWLEEYHNTNYTKIVDSGEFGPEDSWDDSTTRDFYNKYSVTQDQHDEWNKVVREHLPKKLGVSKKIFERSFTFNYLNCAPTIRDKNQ